VLINAVLLDPMLLRRLEEMDGELLAVELVDACSSVPAAAYQGITGARGNEAFEEALAVLELARLRRKLPFRLYIEVLRLTIRGMVVLCDGCWM